MRTNDGSWPAGVGDFVGDERAERRILDGGHRQIAGVHQQLGPRMRPFAAGHRADEGDVVGLLGQLGKALGDLDAGDGGGDGLGFAAVGVCRAWG